MKPFLLSLLFYIPVSSLDIASTRYALSQCPTCREGNPIYSPGLKLGISSSLALWDSKLPKKRKKILRIVFLAGNIFIMSWNIRQATR